MTNNDYIWKVLGSDGKHNVKFEKVYDTRLGVLWFLLTHWSDLPTRFSITRQRKPYLAAPKKPKNKDEHNLFCADDPFVARLANEKGERD